MERERRTHLGKRLSRNLVELRKHLLETRRLTVRRKGVPEHLDLTDTGLERRRGRKLGLRDRLLDRLLTRTVRDLLERLERLGGYGLDVAGLGRDGETEETGIRVGEVERLGGGSRGAELGEGGGTGAPLDGDVAAEEEAEDGKVEFRGGATLEGNQELVDARVTDRRNADLTTVVLGGGGGGGGGGRGGGGEELGNEARELGAVDVGTDDGEVRGSEGGLGEGDGGGVVDGGVGGGEEGVSESLAERELVGEVKGVDARVRDGLLVLAGNLGNNLLVVLVEGELCLSDSVSKRLGEESPAEKKRA